VVFDQQQAFTGAVGGAEGTSVTIPGLPQAVWVGLTAGASGGPHLVLFEGGSASDAVRLTLGLQGEATGGGLRFAFADLSNSPAAAAPGLPLPPGVASGGTATLQLLVAGQIGASDAPQLSVAGVGAQPFSLKPGETATVGGYEYAFVDEKPVVGVEVKKDRGETLVWAGSTMLVLGLCLTLWLPRRRLWAKVTADGLRIAGQAPRTGNLQGELEALAAEAGGRDDRHRSLR
jgi:hypothetical protein